ncbi:hypothetical protein [Chitinimonas sp.]|uniref:hypothetical protein n=1 Tax=Chitinimonas sp. TaxID=1934313 RepID=UPI002F95F838
MEDEAKKVANKPKPIEAADLIQRWGMLCLSAAMFGAGFLKAWADNPAVAGTFFAAGLVCALLSKLHLIEELSAWGVTARMARLQEATDRALATSEQLESLRQELQVKNELLEQELSTARERIGQLQQQYEQQIQELENKLRRVKNLAV